MGLMIWWAIPAFVALVGILLLVGGIGRLLKLRFIGGGLRSVVGLATLAVALIAGLIGLNLQTYAQLSKERLAGRVTIRADKADPHKFYASVDLADKGKLRGKPKEVTLTGERVEVGGPVLKFKPWANVVGVDSMFRVDEVQGSYGKVECQNLYHPKVVSLMEQGGSKDQFRDIKSLGEVWKLFGAVDVAHLSRSAQYMADGASYDIMITQDAFLLRPTDGNQPAKSMQERVKSNSADQSCPDYVDQPDVTPASRAAVEGGASPSPTATTSGPPPQ